VNEAILPERLKRYFVLSLADTPQRRRETYRLRYEIYCQEFGYEREADCPGGLERDEYDEQAIHCAIHHRDSGVLAGCIRLIMASEDPVIGQLPLERHCAESLYETPQHPGCIPREQICEVSRLGIRYQFRRRRGEDEHPFGSAAGLRLPREQERTFPLLASALFAAEAYLVYEAGKQYAYAMMETRLAELLARQGLVFTPIGRVMRYHGKRAAYYIERGELMSSIRASRLLLPLYEMAEEQLGRQTAQLLRG